MNADHTLTRRPHLLTGALSLRSNFTWYLVGVVVYTASQWVILVAISKLSTATAVGQYALALALNAPIALFARLHLRTVLATDSRGEYLFGHYLSLRLSLTVGSLLLVATIALAAGYDLETALIIVMMGVARAFESISDVYYGLLQRKEQMDRIARSLILRSALSVPVLVLGLWLTGRLFWGMAGFTLVWGLMLLLYDSRAGAFLSSRNSIHEDMTPRWEAGRLRDLLFLAFPLGFAMTLFSLSTNIPRYFVQHYLGTADLGIFSAMAYLILTGGLVVNALGQVGTPRLATYLAAHDVPAFRKLLARLLGLGTLLGLAGVLAASILGKELLTWLYRPEYAERIDVLIWIMVAGGAGYVASLLGYGLTATRRFSRLLLPYLALTLIAVLSSWLLVPRYGLLGAAWSMGIVNTLACILLAIVLMATRLGDRAAPANR